MSLKVTNGMYVLMGLSQCGSITILANGRAPSVMTPTRVEEIDDGIVFGVSRKNRVAIALINL